MKWFKKKQKVKKIEQPVKMMYSDSLSGWASPNKNWCFYFHSPYQIEVFKRPIQDGKIRFKDKEWDVSNARAFSMKLGHGFTDGWFLSDKSFFPMSPTDFNVHVTEITPEMMKRIPEQKIFTWLMKRFKSPGSDLGSNTGMIVLGLVFGALALWMLIAFHVIPPDILAKLGLGH